MSNSVIRDLVGNTNPITHAGRVVYNGRRDFIETRKRKRKRGCVQVYGDEFGPDPECHSIQQYEICMRNRSNPYLSWSPNDTDITVFSSANGITLTDAEAAAARAQGKPLPRAKREKLEFAGIASNRAIYDPGNSANEEGLAVQVGGLQTIYNTGDKDINAGDIVLWDMPDLNGAGQPKLRLPGIPRAKKLFATKKYEFDKTFQEYGRNAGDDAGTWEKAAADMWDIQRRVMGKALSTARPGEPFDILLGHYLI